MFRGLRQRVLQNAIDWDRPLASLARWPIWLLACATGRPTMARFATGRLKMRLLPRLHSFGTTSIFIKRDYYEPELLAVRQLIQLGSVVLDIGGSYGIFALFMAHFTGPEGRVHSFEPGAFSFAQLTANIALNGMGQRIIAHHAAASDRPAALRLQHIANSPVNFAIGRAEDADTEEVSALRVVDAVPAADAARVSFIKIDVEGYELAALEGARAILEALHPAIMFEVSASALARQNQTPADIYNFLASFGYDFWIFVQGHFRPVGACVEGNIFAATTNLSAIAA